MEPQPAEMNPTALADYNVFRRKARQASHQALYYLYTIGKTRDDETDRALLAYGGFGLKQVQALVWAVALPRGYSRLPRSSPERRAVRFWQASVRDQLVGERAPDAMTFELARALQRVFRGFLHMTIATDAQAREHRVIAFMKYLNKNLVTALGVAVIAAVYLQVPAVYTLMPRGGWTGLVVALATGVAAMLAWRAKASYGIPRLRRYLTRPALAAWLLLGLAASVWVADAQLEFVVSLGALALALAVHALVVNSERNRLATKTFRSFRYMALAPERGMPRWQPNAEFLDLISKRMLWRLVPLAVLAAVVGGLYLVDGYVEWGATLSVVSILGLTGALLLACYAVDFWDFLDPWPIRVIGIAAFGAFSATAILTPHGHPVACAILLGLGLLGHYHARDRTRRIITPVVFAALAALTAYGGWTLDQSVWADTGQRPWERVPAAEWPYATGEPVVVMAASGGGSRAAVYAAMTLERVDGDYPEIARNLQCISSVSGGSLASAAYVARKYGESAVPPGRPQGAGQLSDLVDRDFIFPTLLGAIIPSMSRGDAIEGAWRDNVGLGTLSLGALSARWMSHTGQYPPFPLPILNSCTLDGHAVVVSALDDTFYVPEPRHRLSDTARTEGAEETWVFDRDGIYGLGQLLDDYDPRLTAAVRASANFPFGFPLVRVRVDSADRLHLTPTGVEPTTRVRLTDGGVLSNSGLWTLYHLLMSKRGALRERGLLLIIVEASRMPTYRDDSRATMGLAGAIGDKNPTGQNLHWRMLQSLRNVYGDRLGVTQIDLVPTREYNVLTTWALGSAASDTVRASFERRWEKEGPSLCRKWNRLVGDERPGLQCGEEKVATDEEMWPGTDRPPLN